jgi:DNA polymerase III epsilon subunit-like protein
VDVLATVTASGPAPGTPPPVPLDHQRFAVVDVETSGLSVRRHRIVQVAVVTALGDGTVVDRWSSYVRAWRVGPTWLHGVTRRRAWRAPPFRFVALDIAQRFDGAVVVAHHARFDWAFLGKAFRRAGIASGLGRQLCTLELSRSLDPDRQRRHTLSDLCMRYGVERGRPHDALADAEATARVLPALLAEAGIADSTALQSRLRTP